MMSSVNLIRVLLFSLALSAPTLQANPFVPDIEPWDVWTRSSEGVTATVSHNAWQSLLDTYLRTHADDGIYRFDYGAVSAADQQRLQAYLDTLTAIDPRDFPRAEQLPYWINLYNALTVAVVIDHYPVKSIRKIHGGLLGTGPWNKKLVDVAGVSLSLNDIEHRILRPIWRDPRIHYGVNCASLGCPNLAAMAYTADNADALLDAGARSYINHPRGVSVENRRGKSRVVASSIYNWYEIDFGGTRTGLLAHWLKYADPELAAKLQGFDGKFRFDYDWKLNQP